MADRKTTVTRAIGLLAALPVAAAALTGCGSSAPSAELNSVKVERAIAGSILTQDHVYSLVSCPQHVPQEAGRKFTCTAKLKAGGYPVHVTETDAKGHVSYANTAPLTTLDMRRIEQAITKSVRVQRGSRARVTCPGAVLQHKGVHFTCTARVKGKSYPFEVTETNDQGHVSFIGR